MPLSRARRWIVAALCAVAVLILVFLLGLPWATRYAVDRVAVLLHDRYDFDFSAGRVEVALTSLSFTLHDVRLASRAAPDSLLVVAPRVNLDLAPAAIRGDLAFDRIELVNPNVQWVTGGIPATRTTPTPHADRPPVVTVGSLDVVNLDAVVTTSSSLRFTVRGLSASLRGGGPGRLAGEVRTDRGILLEGEDVTAVLDRVSADVAVSDSALAIRSLIAGSGAGDLRLNGRVTFSDGGGYDLKYRSTIELGELRKWWGRAPPAAGRVGVTRIGRRRAERSTRDVRRAGARARNRRHLGRTARRNRRRVRRRDRRRDRLAAVCRGSVHGAWPTRAWRWRRAKPTRRRVEPAQPARVGTAARPPSLEPAGACGIGNREPVVGRAGPGGWHAVRRSAWQPAHTGSGGAYGCRRRLGAGHSGTVRRSPAKPSRRSNWRRYSMRPTCNGRG